MGLINRLRWWRNMRYLRRLRERRARIFARFQEQKQEIIADEMDHDLSSIDIDDINISAAEADAAERVIVETLTGCYEISIYTSAYSPTGSGHQIACLGCIALGEKINTEEQRQRDAIDGDRLRHGQSRLIWPPFPSIAPLWNMRLDGVPGQDPIVPVSVLQAAWTDHARNRHPHLIDCPEVDPEMIDPEAHGYAEVTDPEVLAEVEAAEQD